MSRACAEARKWLGATSPNPAVGAVALDESGEVIAVAAHRKAGEGHAEGALLEICRAQNLLPRVDTICVTLEPCNHQGRTPPCTEAIIAAGIRHVVIGTRDPNPHVKGGGAAYLRQRGVEVIEGINENECRQLLAPFSYFVQAGRPFVTVKRAFDGKGSMIPPPGQKTFTSNDSLRFAHLLRKKADAILTGSGTILADHPLFTIRHVEDHLGKRRFLAILDRRGRVPADYLAEARGRGLDPLIYKDVQAALADLADKGARDVLVEAGPALSQAILDSHPWAMSVIIPHHNNDKIEVEFNTQESMPFAPEAFRWDFFLPC
ncbi:MAG TPA: bifunctional diaminohydroxyphosphoribosylaminopyrimidine deaminase/5-amino-6-(5-phosphoribosylamino)uracil reductase RibD [Alphaproteobacteria bacterium]|nr:bifunctional diaminohydroxyphosphoribosylaminopyrimidine deaminase/5-amino-6-(5-phosphoribosylamino)uracil reductase RibD [Alphaproteobacteria bacterium]